MADELLVHVAGHGDIEEAALLLERRRASAAVSLPPSNTTALHAACRAGDLDMVQLLLRYRANPNAKEIMPCGGRAPLHISAAMDYIGVTELLLKEHADSSSQDARGLTPLHTASQEGCCDTVRLLMARGADPHIRDYSGHNAAYWAKAFKHQAVMDHFAEIDVAPRMITAREMVEHGKACREFIRTQAPKKSTQASAGAEGKDARRGSTSPGKKAAGKEKKGDKTDARRKSAG